MNERGSAPTEWVLLVPAIVMVVGVMVAGGRLAWARGAVADAAHAGARAASLQTSAARAESAAQEITRANLAGVGCLDETVAVDVTGFQVPAGQPARVTTTVACRVGLADLLVPGLPGSITVHGDGLAVLDTYRGRR